MKPFDNDIFISYAHLDNEPLPSSSHQEGWVSTFHKYLNVFLGDYLGRKPKIWRDPRLESNSIFSDQIIEELLKAAVLVAVLSPRYVKSDWCKREVERFYEAARQVGLDRVKNRSRIFKVEKYFVERDYHPEELRDQLGCQFFEQDLATGLPREFRVEFGSEAEQRFLLRVSDLAKEITDLLKALEKQPTLSEPGTPSTVAAVQFQPEKWVYLAETTSDLREERDNIRRELEERGYGVLPAQPLPFNASELSACVRTDLQRCQLAIHLVGKHYGLIPEAADESIVALQYGLAIEHGKKHALPCLLWMPPGLVAAEARQQDLIDMLQTAQHDSEVLQVPLEELKTVIQDRLTTPPVQNQTPQSTAESSGQSVYLDCDEQDLEEESLDALYSGLSEMFDEVLLPNFEGDGVSSFVDNDLKQCDAAIVYYGHGNELWLKRRLLALKKRVGYAEVKPLLAKAVYVAAPVTPKKQAYSNRDLLVIKQLEEFSPDLLQPFFAQLQQSQQGAA